MEFDPSVVSTIGTAFSAPLGRMEMEQILGRFQQGRRAGALRQASASDNQGYHTPRELAARHGQAKCNALVEAVEWSKLAWQ